MAEASQATFLVQSQPDAPQIEHCTLATASDNHRPIASLNLPPELLGKIFRDCTSCGNRCYRPWDCEHFHLEFSHVCRYWRAVALNSGALWNTFNASSPTMTAEMITRSKTLALSISLPDVACSDGYGQRFDFTVQTIGHVAHAAPRIRFLRLYLSHSWSKEILSRLHVSFPYLETLVIDHCPHISPGGKSILPWDAFGGGADRLHFLALDRVIVLGSCPLLSNLRRLHLRNAFEGTAQRLPLASALGSLPYLEDLHLEYFAFLVEATPSRPIHLLKLRHLHFAEGDADDLNLSFTFFSLPRDAIEDIYITITIWEPEDMGTVARGVKYHTQNAAPTRLILSFGADVTSVAFWNDTNVDACPLIRLPSLCYPTVLRHLFTSPRAPSLGPNIRVLEVSGKDNVDIQICVDLSSCLVNVHTVVLGLGFEAATAWLAALRGPVEPASARPLFRSCETLVIRRTHFFLELDNEKQYAIGAEWTLLLVEVVQHRLSRGRPLRLIRIEDCPWIDIDRLAGDVAVSKQEDGLSAYGEWGSVQCDV